MTATSGWSRASRRTTAATAPAGTSGETPARSAPRLAGAELRDDALEPLDALHDAARLVEQDGARGRQLDPSRGADEQLDAQRGLERLDPLAQRRLRDVQALRGAREMQLLGDGDEVAEVSEQVHRASS